MEKAHWANWAKDTYSRIERIFEDSTQIHTIFIDLSHYLQQILPSVMREEGQAKGESQKRMK